MNATFREVYIDVLYKSNIYYFEVGQFFSVKTKKKNSQNFTPQPMQTRKSCELYTGEKPGGHTNKYRIIRALCTD